jgi:hypothetical protein
MIGSGTFGLDDVLFRALRFWRERMVEMRNIINTGVLWMSLCRVLMFVDARLGRGSGSLGIVG